MRTERLTLRALGDGDKALLVALRTDADVRRYLGGVTAISSSIPLVSRRLLERLGMTASEQFEEFGEQQTLYRLQRPALRGGPQNSS